jgi:glycosyltransferase involved in cell wall biosynthesis
MKILVIYGNGFPNMLAMTNRLKLYVKGLVEMNNEIQIIIPHATEKKDKVISSQTQGNFCGAHFKYLSCTTERSRSFILRRIFDFAGYLKLCRLLIFSEKPNIIFLIDIRHFWSIPICFICKVMKVKVIYELNEHPSLFSSRFIYGLQKKFIFSLFDGYIIISKNLEILVKDLNEKCKTLIVPILTEIDPFVEIDPIINDNEDFIIHSGSLVDRKEGIIDLIKAVDFVNNNDPKKIKLYFTGDLINSPDRLLIDRTIEQLKHGNNIIFLGYLKDNELKKFQRNSLLGVINKPDNLQNNHCFPTKLGEYLCIAKPVIATNVGEYMNYLKNGFNAIILEENTPECLGSCIIKVLNNKEVYQRIGINGKMTADIYFNYQTQAIKINQFFENIIK